MMLVGTNGLEPSTSRLSGGRSNHLSYAPKFFGFVLILLPTWWRWGGSNSWPPACKAGALPAELHPQVSLSGLVPHLIVKLIKVDFASFTATSKLNNKTLPETRLKLFEHEQSIVVDCDVWKASFNASLKIATTPQICYAIKIAPQISCRRSLF